MRKNQTASVREADQADINELCHMLGGLFSVEDDFCADYEKQKTALEILIDKKTGSIIFVAESDGGIAGMINLQKIVSTAAGGYSILLEDLYVKNKYRDSGIGGMLVNRALQWAKSEGALRIQLAADIRNKKALSFYNNNGFTISNMVLYYKYISSNS